MRLHTLIPNTVGLYQLQDTLTDDSPTGANLTKETVGSDTFDDFGGGLRCFNFNNTTVLLAAAAAAHRLTGELTIEFLIAATASDDIIIACDSPSNTCYGGGYTGPNKLFAINATPTIGYSDIRIVGTLAPPTNTEADVIQHWCFTRTSVGGGAFLDRFYRNGVLRSTVGTAAGPALAADGTERMRIGANFTGTPQAHFKIASIRILNYPRSPTEVLDDATKTIATTSTVKTTARYIAEDPILQAFYYLKISGLPYYFGTLGPNPTDPSWGGNQWTLPTGYTWINGMDIPDGTLDQALPNIIGGTASAEQIRLQMVDFDVVDVNGKHSFFGRLLSPGRTTSSLTATRGTLNADLLASQATGTFDVLGSTGAFTGAAGEVDTFIGSETIGVTAVSGPTAGVYTLTIGTRNKYPCHANYPPRGTYRIGRDPHGLPDPTQSIRVSQVDPTTFLNRSAALYIGHLTPDGKPEPEANSLCRFVGHVRGINYGREPGKFEFEIESVVTDIDKALVAPGLASASVVDGIQLPAGDWQKIGIRITGVDKITQLTATDVKIIQVPLTTYPTAYALLAAIGTQLASTSYFDVGGTKFYVSAGQSDVTIGNSWHARFTATSLAATAPQDQEWTLTLYFPRPDGTGLLSALGFPIGVNYATTESNNSIAVMTIDASAAPARVFFPLNTGAGVAIGTYAASGAFFVDQGDGSSTAYVRLFDGQVVAITALGIDSVTIYAQAISGVNAPFRSFAYCPVDEDATVEQVIHLPSGNITAGEQAIFQLLGSKGYDGDGLFNVFPPGVGLGLNGIMDDDAFSQTVATLGTSSAFSLDVDRSMKFSDLWAGISKLHGWFLVWDPSLCAVSLRALRMPSSATASTFQFSESNRTPPGDRSKVQTDLSNLRTGWIIKYGWDYKEKKFTAGDFTVNDNFAAADNQISARTETIEDRTVPAKARLFAITNYLAALLARSVFTQSPWSKVTRQVNKTGLLLCPGDYHKVIDNTIYNPFTARMGITSADEVYGFILSVRMNYKTGDVTATFLVNATDDAARQRPWSPTALVDFDAASHGYDSGTGVLTLKRWYEPDAAKYDGYQFLVGDKVMLIDRQVEGAPTVSLAEITAKATNGLTVTIDAGLGISSTAETIMVLQPWADQTDARKSDAATRVTFQGDGVALLIDGDAILERWS